MELNTNGLKMVEKDILLADDDPDDVHILESALQATEIPFELRHAPNGDVLFVLLKEKLPYILFLDINMPCRDGLACIAEIRKNREYDQLPVIMYTSFFTEQRVEESFRSGANLFMQKSHSFQELVARLRKILSINWKEYLHFPSRDEFVLS